MLNSIKMFFRKINATLYFILLQGFLVIFKGARAARAERWRKNQGDRSLRLNYPMAPSSLVFDVGGYEGQWAQDIFCKYQCSIHIFEPVEKFANKIRARFSGNNQIIIHQFGLGNKNCSEKISVNDDSSSVYKSNENSEIISIVKVSDFVKENKINHLDLIKINIEGGEYDLLEDLIENGLVEKIDNIQVQFHDFVEEADEKMRKIQSSLSQTHHLTYQSAFVWENWEINK